MFLRLLFTLLISFFVTGCGGPRYVDFFPYHDNGTIKPHIALIPVINSTEEVSWDIGQELTAGIRYEMMNNGELFLFSTEKVRNDMARLGQVNYFGHDVSFARVFSKADFVVVSELIEHRLVPYEKNLVSCVYEAPHHPNNQILLMKLRVRIIDARCEHPIVVHQEILQSNHVVSQKEMEKWMGDSNDNVIQERHCGLVHQRLISEFTRRIEEVTTCNLR